MSTCVAGYAADDRRGVNLKVEPVLAQISRRGDRLHSANAACAGRMARSFRQFVRVILQSQEPRLDAAVALDAVVWSLGFLVLYQLPDSKRYGDMASLRSDADLLDLFLNPTYVSLPQWLTQLVVTSILTALVATAVYRSRMHLLARVRAAMPRRVPSHAPSSCMLRSSDGTPSERPEKRRGCR
jgi:hypothetical protein